MVFFKGMDLPTLFFRGTTGRGQLCRLQLFAFPGTLFARGETFCGFLVQGARLRRAASLVGNGQNNDLLFIESLTNLKFGLQFNDFAGFGALAIVLNLATLNGLLGERSSLEKTRGPQPFIQPHAGCCLWVLVL